MRAASMNPRAGLRAAAVAAALAIGVAAGLHACSNTEQQPAECDPAACPLDCWTARWSGGECRDNECRCFSWGTDAGADDSPDESGPAPDVRDVREDGPDRAAEDVRDDAPDVRDVRDEYVRPDVRDEFADRDDCCPEHTDPDYHIDPETSDGSKSGCDPLLCFLNCGGTCSARGECECAPPP